jgi:hypothetical protein
MDPLPLIAIIILTGALGTVLGAALDIWRYQKQRRSESPWPPRPEGPSSHVHTFRFSSSENVADMHVNVYRCIDCPEIERWVTPP